MTKKKRSKKKNSKSCPTPNKVVYYKAYDAFKALQQILNRVGAVDTKSRVYLCSCGRFHITTGRI